jgi:hypothetical protein
VSCTVNKREYKCLCFTCLMLFFFNHCHYFFLKIFPDSTNEVPIPHFPHRTDLVSCYGDAEVPLPSLVFLVFPPPSPLLLFRLNLPCRLVVDAFSGMGLIPICFFFFVFPVLLVAMHCPLRSCRCHHDCCYLLSECCCFKSCCIFKTLSGHAAYFSTLQQSTRNELGYEGGNLSAFRSLCNEQLSCMSPRQTT